MSRINRSDILDLDVPTTCLITSSFVRGLPLCGKGEHQPDYSYRRGAIEEHLTELVHAFAICLINQATLSDRTELLLQTRPDRAMKWSAEEVIRRACTVFRYTFRRKGVRDGSPTEEQLQTLTADETLVATMRDRLRDPSWLMRQLLWRLAWVSNREDQIDGHFVACRFDLRVVTDDFGILASSLALDLRQMSAPDSGPDPDPLPLGIDTRWPNQGPRTRQSTSARWSIRLETATTSPIWPPCVWTRPSVGRERTFSC